MVVATQLLEAVEFIDYGHGEQQVHVLVARAEDPAYVEFFELLDVVDVEAAVSHRVYAVPGPTPSALVEGSVCVVQRRLNGAHLSRDHSEVRPAVLAESLDQPAALGEDEPVQVSGAHLRTEDLKGVSEPTDVAVVRVVRLVCDLLQPVPHPVQVLEQLRWRYAGHRSDEHRRMFPCRARPWRVRRARSVGAAASSVPARPSEQGAEMGRRAAEGE